jgi:GNAT superfamily N-acetyltransferase
MDKDIPLDASLAALIEITQKSYPKECAPIANSQWAWHLQPENPLWKHVEHKAFIVEDGNDLAHSMAIIDPRLNGIGIIGYFVATSVNAGIKVVTKACEWLKDKGIKDVYGPINGTITADYRFNTMEDYVIPGEPVNPTWYIDVFNRVGFSTYNNYVSGYVAHPYAYIKLAMTGRGTYDTALTLRAFDSSQTEKTLNLYHSLMNAIFPANSVYCPVISFDERKYNVEKSGTTFDGRYCYFAYHDDIPVGFIVSYPYKGSLLIKTIGVVPEYRGKRISNLLVHRVHEIAKEDGLKTAIYSTIRETTNVYKMRRPGVKVYRRYVTMHRAI